MSGHTVVILTGDLQFAEQIRAALHGIDILSRRCLHVISRDPVPLDAPLVIDPATAPDCCRELLQARAPWLRWMTCAPDPLLQVNPPAVGRFIQAQTIGLRSLPHLAWADRERMLAFDGQPEKAHRFIALARDHEHENLSVSEAAFFLNVSIRTLRRLSHLTFGYAPKLVIDLVRIACVAREIERNGDVSLASIARGHAFSDQSTMDRFFIRFVGVSIGRYRSLVSLLRRRCRMRMADIA